MKRILPIVLGLFWGASVAAAQTTSTSTTYSFPDRGGFTVTTAGGTGAMTVGYARVQPGGGTTAPAAFAIFGARVGGVLVSGTSVPAMPAVLSGRTFAEVNSPVNTGIAFANPNGFPVTISFFFTDQTGAQRFQGNFTLNAGAQLARFINQAPFNVTGVFTGTMTFNASFPVGAIGIRGFTNERGEFLMTTLPIASITLASSVPVVIPHFADGGGWKTEVLLVNPTDSTLTGTIQFISEGSDGTGGIPIPVAGVLPSYSIPARSSLKVETSGLGTTTTTGSVLLTPLNGSSTASGSAVFSLVTNAGTVTQSSISAQPAGSVFRMYVESRAAVDTVGAVDTGIGIANTSATAATVNLDLTSLNGMMVQQTAIVTVPPSGHISRFLHELFPNLPTPFRGVLRINANTSQIVVAGLLTRFNERGEFLIATTPASNELTPSQMGELIMPHIVDNGGLTTQFVVFSGSQYQSGVGILSFFDQSGQPLPLTFQ